MSILSSILSQQNKQRRAPIRKHRALRSRVDARRQLLLENLEVRAVLTGSDSFAGATVIPSNNAFYTDLTDNSTYTLEAGEPAGTIGGTTPGKSIWWKFQAPLTGNVTLNTYPTIYPLSGGYGDTTLEVFTGAAINSLTLVTSNDDIGFSTQYPYPNPGDYNPNSLVTFPVTAGTTYYVRVDGFDTTSPSNNYGPTRLNYQFSSDVVYVDDSFVGYANGDTVTDADLGTAGNQAGIFNVTAFTTITAALAAVKPNGTVIINHGTYNESVAATGSQILRLTKQDAVNNSNVVISSLDTSATALIDLQSNTLTVGDATGNNTIASVIQGSGGLVKQGADTLTLSGLNTFTGNTLISAGTVVAASSNTVTGAFGAFNSSPTKIVVQNGATLDVNGRSAPGLDFYYGVTIAGSGTSGQGALINNGANGGGGNVQLPFITLSADATIGGSGNLYILNYGYGATTLTLNNFTLTKTGTSTFFLVNTTVTAGTINIANGTLSQATNPANLSAVNIVLANTAGATLALGGFNTTIASLAGGGTTGGNVNLGGNTLTINQSSTTTYGGIISGTGGLTKSGTGTLTLSGLNTYTGNTLISAGTVIAGASNTGFGSFGAFNAAATKIVVQSGATLDVNGRAAPGLDFFYGVTISGSGTSGQGALINSGANGGNGQRQLPFITLSGNATIGGSGNIYMINGGYAADTLDLAGFTLTKTGNNTFFLVNTTVTAGTISIANGTLSQSNVASNLSAANIVLANTAGATLALGGFNMTVASISGGGTTGGNVNLGANTLTINQSITTTYAGVISGSGGLTKTGTGTITIGGINTYTGNTLISAGMVIAGGGSITSGAFGAFNSAVNKIVVQSGATLDVNGRSAPGIDFYYGVTIAGTGTSGQGALINTGANGGAGNVQLPFITLSADATIGGSGNLYMINYGYGATTLTLGGFTLTKTGSSTFFLSNTTVTAGTINIANGTLSQANVGSNLSAANIVLANTAGAALALGGFNMTIASLAGGGTTGGSVSLGANTLTVAQTSSTVYSGVISGAGSLVKSGTGTLVLAAANTYGGGTILSQGTLELRHFDALGLGPVTINDVNTGANNTALLASYAAQAPIDNLITVTNNGSGTSTIGSLPAVVNLGGFAIVEFNNTITLNKPTTFQGQNTDRTTYTGVITGNVGTLTVSGGRRSTWEANNTFVGNVIITGSGTTLQIGGLAGNQIPDASNVDIGAGAFLTLNNDGESINTLTGSGNVQNIVGGNTLTIGANGGGGTYGGTFSNGSGALSIVKTGAGTQIFTGVSSTTGGVTVNGGVLRFNAAGVPFDTGVFPGGQTIAVNNNAQLDIANSWNVGSANIITANGSTVNVSSGSAADSVNYINRLNLNGGTLTGNPVRAGNSSDAVYTVGGSAPSTISAGIYLVNDVDVTGVRTITFNVSDAVAGADLLVTGVIRDLGQNTTAPARTGTDLIKTGAGTMLLQAANTYTGPTLVNAGTLGGDGSIAGTLAVSSGATLSPGTTIGDLASGSVTLASGAILTVQLSNTTPGTGYDQLIVNGTVTINGATLTASHVTSATLGDIFRIISNDGSDPTVGQFGNGSPDLNYPASTDQLITIGGALYYITYNDNAIPGGRFGTGNDVALIRNREATAVNDTFGPILQNSVFTGNVKANDTDPDRDGVVGIVSGPSNGVVTLLDPLTGEFSYEPDIDFTGTDTFTYELFDGETPTTATVTITVTNIAIVGGTLYVSGSSNSDRIILSPGASGGVLVRYNNLQTGPYNVANDIVVYGNGGDDTITSSLSRSVTLYGDDGNDYLTSGAGNDTLDGGAGNDRLLPGAGNDVLLGGDDNDTLTAGAGNDLLYGDAYLDHTGAFFSEGSTPGRDTLSGEAGNDTLYGGSLGDTLNGGLGNDFLRGGEGDDTLTGDDGNDLLLGDTGNDKLYGRAGRDVLIGGDGSDTLLGGTGSDLMYGSDLLDDSDATALAIATLWFNPATQASAITSLTSDASDDGVGDSLNGEGDADWYLLYLLDSITLAAEKNNPNKVINLP